MKTFIIWIVAALIVIFIIIVYIPKMQHDLYLVAQKDVPVYASEKDAMALVPSNTVLKLVPLQRVQVIECIDVKHYLIYKVRMANGQQGFINGGEYLLKRFNQPASCLL